MSEKYVMTDNKGEVHDVKQGFLGATRKEWTWGRWFIWLLLVTLVGRILKQYVENTWIAAAILVIAAVILYKWLSRSLITPEEKKSLRKVKT